MKPVEILISCTPLIFIGLTAHFNNKINIMKQKQNQRLDFIEEKANNLQERLNNIIKTIKN